MTLVRSISVAGPQRVVAPLTGNVTTGSWASKTLASGPSMPSGQRMRYDYILPSGYAPPTLYPILIWEHANFEGNDWYSGANRSAYMPGLGPDGWFNIVAFRRAYPCIIALPYCDQTTDNTGGALQNFGGWEPPGDLGPSMASVPLMVAELIASFSADPSRVYLMGDSLGGIGTIAGMRRYNRLNGDLGKVYTAGMPFAGVYEANGYGAGPNAADIAALRNVPMFAISGQGDGTSIPSHWNEPLWTAYAGNTTYPNQSTNGGQAGTSAFRYVEITGLGNPHDCSSYHDMPAAIPYLNWLFAQIIN